MITLYQCSFCGEQFPNKESCLEHERAFPVEPHKYKVGEEVLLVPKYPDDEKRFFEKRVIVSLLWSPYDKLL